ncbi:probable pectin methylesterase CGR2 isoform X2 [Primulina eburnea]|uniref:probable pectin methylesterase CGR2 isoform X2 n=1 Tax=Primulina eburnea TaxID=1245227 RepID=UPI003C6C463C
MAMARRPINPSRRTSESGGAPFASSLRSRSRSHPYLPTAFIIVGGLLLIGYFYRGRGDFSCTVEVQRAIPLLKMAYGGSMHRVLHVGPDTCSVVSRLLKEKDTEAWGVEPYDIEDADRKCKSLVHRGIVRVADIKFPLPYRAKSFSHVIVSDALDYLSPKYLNRTLPELARVSADGVVIFTGYPHHQKAKVVDKAKYGRLAKLRSSIWWIRYFVQMSLEENEAVIKKFEQAAVKRSYTSNCQIFHLNSYS